MKLEIKFTSSSLTGRRDDIAYAIMEYLNNNDPASSGGIFDCGEYGICRLSWHGMTWVYFWYEPIKIELIMKE